MKINKISPNTPDIFKVENYLTYYKIKDEHIVIIDETLAKVFSKSDYEAINNHIFDTLYNSCCYDVEDKGEYWEFVEEDVENTKYDYEPDDDYNNEGNVIDTLESVISTEELNHIPYTEYYMGITSIDNKPSSIYEKAIFVTPTDNVIGDDEIIDDLNVRYFPISKYIDSPFELLSRQIDVISNMADDIIDYITTENN